MYIYIQQEDVDGEKWILIFISEPWWGEDQKGLGVVDTNSDGIKK